MNELNILVDEWAILQAGVDETIYKRFNIKAPKKLLPGLLLALKVELGELANETRCFKHWSEKPEASPAVILEELADNIAFVLSIGLVTGYLLERDTGKRLYYNEAPVVYFSKDERRERITEQFNLVFKAAARYEAQGDFLTFVMLFQELLNLASVIGFRLRDLDEGYRNKTAINLERQEAGY